MEFPFTIGSAVVAGSLMQLQGGSSPQQPLAPQLQIPILAYPSCRSQVAVQICTLQLGSAMGSAIGFAIGLCHLGSAAGDLHLGTPGLVSCQGMSYLQLLEQLSPAQVTLCCTV